MGHFAGTTFGIGTPTTYPFGSQGFGVPSITAQPYLQPFSSQSIGGYGIGGAPQLLQLLQIVAQQLQQVQLLQQQQLLQLQQLQQLIQIVPQQVHHLQQQWQAFNPAISGSLGFGSVPQAFGPVASHVM
jgi:hypothetical protein